MQCIGEEELESNSLHPSSPIMTW